MRRGVSVLVNLLLLTVSVAACAALAEFGARALVRHWAAQPQTTHGSVARYHALLGWDKPPGATVALHRPEYTVELAVNAKGLRGPDRPYEKRAGTRRVLLAGDSFTEGYTVDEPLTARARLEALLSARGCGAHEVLNAGTAAWSTDQEYLFFREEGHRYAPDLVVLLFFYNDLHGNSTGENTLLTAEGWRGKPYFDLGDGGGLVLRNTPVPAPPEDARVSRPQPRPFRLKPWRGSMALRLLSNRTVESNPPLHRFLARFGLVEPDRVREMPREFLPFGPRGAGVVDMWRRTDAILDAFAKDVHARGASFAVFYVPARFEVNGRAWELTRTRYRMNPRRWEHDRVYRRLAQACERLGIPLIDPRRALAEKEGSGGGAYLPKDGHWGAGGHEVAAREIAAFVEAKGLLACR